MSTWNRTYIKNSACKCIVDTHAEVYSRDYNVVFEGPKNDSAADDTHITHEFVSHSLYFMIYTYIYSIAFD